ncbi:MAG: GvpL/GvpF family gas vesicle protein [Pseudomonadota bacterium]
MIYLFGLLEASDDAAASLEGSTGVKGPVCVTGCSGLHLIFEPHDSSEVLPRRRSLLTHARVLENAMTAGTVLPMCFGMTCASLCEIQDLVEAGASRIRAQFEKVRGRVEMGVRLAAPEADALAAALQSAPPLLTERDRLVSRGHEAHFAKAEFGRHLGDVVATRRQAAQTAVLAQLRSSAVDHVLKAPESDFEVLRAEFLVDRSKVAAFSDHVERAVQSLDFASPAACTAQIIGPGPAFHFVDLSLVPAEEPA